MGNYNFDEIIDRKNTNSLKHDFKKEKGMPEEVLPLWVADMDFRAPREVLEAMQNVVSHGIFGYSDVKNTYNEVVANWFKSRFHGNVRPEWIVKSPGVVFAISAAIRAFTEEGDRVLIQQPVYYPFASCVKGNNRVLVNNELHYENGKYSIDFEDFEKKIVEEKVKLFILCSPHNPVGRVWTREELERLTSICLEHAVLIVSDEIHSDFVYPGHEHVLLTNISEEVADQCILCTSPSKSFNLAGLQVSNIFVKDPKKRKELQRAIHKTGYDEINVMGLAACQAAYEYGADWLEDVKKYIFENYQFAKEFINGRIEKIKVVETEGTYLLWMDCSELGLKETELEELIIHKAHLWLDGGCMFGTKSGQFQRINLTSPRAVLQEALERLENAVNEIA